MWRKLLVVILVTLMAHVPKLAVNVMAQSTNIAKQVGNRLTGWVLGPMWR